MHQSQEKKGAQPQWCADFCAHCLFPPYIQSHPSPLHPYPIRSPPHLPLRLLHSGAPSQAPHTLLLSSASPHVQLPSELPQPPQLLDAGVLLQPGQQQCIYSIIIHDVNHCTAVRRCSTRHMTPTSLLSAFHGHLVIIIKKSNGCSHCIQYTTYCIRTCQLQRGFLHAPHLKLL